MLRDGFALSYEWHFNSMGCILKKVLSIFLFLVVWLLAFTAAGDTISFLAHPMLAGHASLTENGFVVSRTLGTANCSTELQIPVQILYESFNEQKGIFGYG